jgi:hypothetical protein
MRVKLLTILIALHKESHQKSNAIPSLHIGINNTLHILLLLFILFTLLEKLLGTVTINPKLGILSVILL